MTLRSAVGWLLLALALVAANCKATGDEANAPDAWVTIRNARVAAEVVVTPEEQALGLGERDSLAWNHGMLFVYDRPRFLRFWMKGMRFDIDIVWIRDGRVIDIHHRVPHVEAPDGPWPYVAPRSMADRVLEVPAGYAEASAWRAGDRVQVEMVGSSD